MPERGEIVNVAGAVIRHDWTDAQLMEIYDGLKREIDQMVGMYDKLKQNPRFAAHVDKRFKNAEDWGKFAMKRLDYCFTIKKGKEAAKQHERCENLITEGGKLKIPLVVFLDIQLKSVLDVINNGKFPTFYSYWHKNYYKNGRGVYGIAFPPRITEMNDEELRVALAHEFGHIRQKHLFYRKPNHEVCYNRAMDYSINFGFDEADRKRYVKVANKLFDGGVGATIVSYPREKGGLGVNVAISHEWREIHKIIHMLEENPNAGSLPMPQQPQEIEVGSIVKVRGKDQYGQVQSIDEKTGRLTTIPLTKKEALEKLRQQSQGQQGQKPRGA